MNQKKKIASSLIFRQNDNWDFHHHLVLFFFQGEYWRAAIKRMSFPRTAQAGKAIPFWSMQFKQKLFTYQFTMFKQTICFKMILMRESLALRAKPMWKLGWLRQLNMPKLRGILETNTLIASFVKSHFFTFFSFHIRGRPLPSTRVITATPAFWKPFNALGEN